MIAWPLVKARLVAALPTLPGWDQVSVFSGPPVTGSAPQAYATVGFVFGEDMAGSYEQVRGIGDLDDENGTVRSEVVCSTGRVDLPRVEAQAFALADAVQAWVNADPTLGVLPAGSTSSLTVDVIPAQTTDGAAQRLVLVVNYTARA